ncbi:MAG: AAA family ATPase [Alphaproteobacteria bacterium]|nr:AAA family ATPase [Alphaproteobacteria bacterium]
MRIEICGGIASGKTTLARCLDDAGFAAYFENFQSNPFWKLFYENPGRYAFETEITFFLQHYSQFRDAQDANADHVVCDSSLLQDVAYANVNLAGPCLAAFTAVANAAQGLLGPPALVVHLTCSAEEELRRIRARARDEERGIQTSYLGTIRLTYQG